MSEIVKKTIQEVKIAKGRTLQITLKEHLNDGTFRDVVMKCDQLYHKDMEIAFNKFKPFLVDICDLYERETLSGMDDFENETLEKIEVYGVKITGSHDNEAIVISGNKAIKDKVFNLISPTAELLEYEKGEELAVIVENIRFEATEYLNGKYAIKQQEIPFPEEKTEGEYNKEASDVAGEVLSNLAESILNDIGASSVTITTENKGKRKGTKVVKMSADVAQVEGF